MEIFQIQENEGEKRAARTSGKQEARKRKSRTCVISFHEAVRAPRTLLA